MKGDMQVLTYEYCQNHGMARFAMNSLQEYECLVLETLEKKQSLFIWKANVVQTHETLASQDPSESKTPDEPETPPEHSQTSHQFLVQFLPRLEPDLDRPAGCRNGAIDPSKAASSEPTRSGCEG